MTAQDGPTTVETLARLIGSHSNTIREHLATLISAGVVERRQAPPTGRGRPRWHYLPTHASRSESAAYEGLAISLVAQLERVANDPRGAAIEAGEHWGADLAEHTDADDGIRRRVLTVLDQLGFDPDPQLADGRVRLRSCPMLGAAEQHPDVVCSVHLGVVRGVVRSAGGNPDDVELLSFYEPDACHLRIHGAVDDRVRGDGSSR